MGSGVVGDLALLVIQQILSAPTVPKILHTSFSRPKALPVPNREEVDVDILGTMGDAPHMRRRSERSLEVKAPQTVISVRKEARSTGVQSVSERRSLSVAPSPGRVKRYSRTSFGTSS